MRRGRLEDEIKQQIEQHHANGHNAWHREGGARRSSWASPPQGAFELRQRAENVIVHRLRKEKKAHALACEIIFDESNVSAI